MVSRVDLSMRMALSNTAPDLPLEGYEHSEGKSDQSKNGNRLPGTFTQPYACPCPGVPCGHHNLPCNHSPVAADIALANKPLAPPGLDMEHPIALPLVRMLYDELAWDKTEGIYNTLLKVYARADKDNISPAAASKKIADDRIHGVKRCKNIFTRRSLRKTGD